MKLPEWMESWPPLVTGLLFYGSRKFGTGLWIITASTAMVFLATPPMGLSDWKDMVFVAAILIGGGTVADTWLGKKKKGDDAPPPADR